MLAAFFPVLGFVSLLFASILQAYCEFGRQAKPEFRPGVFETRWSYLLQSGWVILLLVGGVLLLLTNLVYSLIGVAAFWLLLPISVGPRVRRRFLPSWDELKHELEKQGYNERNYWRGNWWRADAKRRTGPKAKSSPDEQARRLESGKDHHRILRVTRNASDEEITEAFRRMAKRYHPDRNGGNEEWANERMKEVNEAYEALRNRDNRTQSD